MRRWRAALGLLLRVLPQGPGSLRLPANNRYVDVLKATGDELTPYFAGQTNVADATSKAAQAINQILGQ